MPFIPPNPNDLVLRAAEREILKKDSFSARLLANLISQGWRLISQKVTRKTPTGGKMLGYVTNNKDMVFDNALTQSIQDLAIQIMPLDQNEPSAKLHHLSFIQVALEKALSTEIKKQSTHAAIEHLVNKGLYNRFIKWTLGPFATLTAMDQVITNFRNSPKQLNRSALEHLAAQLKLNADDANRIYPLLTNGIDCQPPQLFKTGQATLPAAIAGHATNVGFNAFSQELPRCLTLASFNPVLLFNFYRTMADSWTDSEKREFLRYIDKNSVQLWRKLSPEAQAALSWMLSFVEGWRNQPCHKESGFDPVLLIQKLLKAINNSSFNQCLESTGNSNTNPLESMVERLNLCYKKHLGVDTTPTFTGPQLICLENAAATADGSLGVTTLTPASVTDICPTAENNSQFDAQFIHDCIINLLAYNLPVSFFKGIVINFEEESVITETTALVAKKAASTVYFACTSESLFVASLFFTVNLCFELVALLLDNTPLKLITPFIAIALPIAAALFQGESPLAAFCKLGLSLYCAMSLQKAGQAFSQKFIINRLKKNETTKPKEPSIKEKAKAAIKKAQGNMATEKEETPEEKSPRSNRRFRLCGEPPKQTTAVIHRVPTSHQKRLNCCSWS
jgi:hypothetical protein